MEEPRYLLKGGWPKPPKEQTQAEFRRFTHFLEELNHRGFDMSIVGFAVLSEAEKAEVLRGFPTELAEMYSSVQKKQA